MKMRIAVWVSLMAALASPGLFAKEIKVVVPQLSPQATEVYSKLAVAVIEATGNTASIQVVPFARAIHLMEEGQADVASSIVEIPDQTKWSTLKFDYSTVTALKIVFVLYASKNNTIQASELKAGNPKGYKIETDIAHVGHFSFVPAGSTSIDGSLKKIDANQIDGFIFSQGSTDAALKRLALKNVARQYYDTLNGAFVIQKGTRGGEIDKILSAGMAKIKQNGKYQEIVGPYSAQASSFLDWQP